MPTAQGILHVDHPSIRLDTLPVLGFYELRAGWTRRALRGGENGGRHLQRATA